MSSPSTTTRASAPSAQPAEAAQPAGFEASLARLAELVGQLEAGGLGLSESIDAYERGVAILRRLHDELAAAEQRVSVLVRIGEDGRPVLAAHDAPAADAPAPAAPPPAGGGRGRGRRTRSLPGIDDVSDG